MNWNERYRREAGVNDRFCSCGNPGLMRIEKDGESQWVCANDRCVQNQGQDGIAQVVEPLPPWATGPTEDEQHADRLLREIETNHHLETLREQNKNCAVCNSARENPNELIGVCNGCRDSAIEIGKSLGIKVHRDHHDAEPGLLAQKAGITLAEVHDLIKMHRGIIPDALPPNFSKKMNWHKRYRREDN